MRGNCEADKAAAVGTRLEEVKNREPRGTLQTRCKSQSQHDKRGATKCENAIGEGQMHGKAARERCTCP